MIVAQGLCVALRILLGFIKQVEYHLKYVFFRMYYVRH